MRAWVVHELGDPENVLRLEAVPRPHLENEQVRVRVTAAALNFLDILLCLGQYQEKPPLPFTPGSEICGIITETSEASSFKMGQRVIGIPALPHGGLAEEVVLPEQDCFLLPDSISDAQGAALLISYQTAYYALVDRTKLQPNDVLLVHAGAGGVGSAAVQIGKALGAIVIATAGGAEKTELCQRIGADYVVDYLKEDFVPLVKELTNGKGADVVFDPVGGNMFDKSRKCIAFDGRIVVIGFAGGKIAEAPTNHILVKNYSVVGVHWGLLRKVNPDKVEEIHRQLIEMYEQGTFQPQVYREFQFEDVKTALKLLASRKTWGKLIVSSQI